MSNDNLDEFEQDILASVENDEWQSKGNIQERLAELQGFLKHEKKKAVSIRLSENDLYELKRKSLENGVPYHRHARIPCLRWHAPGVRLGWTFSCVRCAGGPGCCTGERHTPGVLFCISRWSAPAVWSGWYPCSLSARARSPSRRAGC